MTKNLYPVTAANPSGGQPSLADDQQFSQLGPAMASASTATVCALAERSQPIIAAYFPASPVQQPISQELAQTTAAMRTSLALAVIGRKLHFTRSFHVG